jgi:hypothetical protein
MLKKKHCFFNELVIIVHTKYQYIKAIGNLSTTSVHETITKVPYLEHINKKIHINISAKAATTTTAAAATSSPSSSSSTTFNSVDRSRHPGGPGASRHGTQGHRHGPQVRSSTTAKTG